MSKAASARSFAIYAAQDDRAMLSASDIDSRPQPPGRVAVFLLGAYHAGRAPPARSSGMHTGNSIIMQAPKEAIFETAANLELWPKILPHYRYIRYLQRGETRNIVVMAAVRSGIPISWTSEQIIDRQKFEIRFNHMRKWTKGMRVVWRFTETPAGVSVEIVHDMRFRVPALAWLAEPIIGGFFIHHIASQTLRCMKAHLEAQHMVAGGK